MFGLADCNNFYASCERVFNPALRGRPIAVLSNNDGCVIARSAEAKAIGVPMGAPAFKIRDLVARHGVAVFSSNYTLYGDLSSRVMRQLAQYTPALEVYSIDEAFLDLSAAAPGGLRDWALRIRGEVTRFTGIPISIGVAATKTLAKAANDLAKHEPAHGGVLVLEGAEACEAALRRLPVEDVWGVGRRYGDTLAKRGVRTAWDFTRLPDDQVRKTFTVMGLRTKRELLGESCHQIETFPPMKKAICTARSFGALLTDLESVEEAVAAFASSCGAKLRREKACANLLMVFIHTNQFRPEDAQYAQNRVVRLPVATQSSPELARAARLALRDIFRGGYRYKKAGVIVSGLVPETEVQQALFDAVDRDAHRRAMKALDTVNAAYGRGVLKLASQGSGRRWKLRQERLSPCYTTRWDDIITVKV